MTRILLRFSEKIVEQPITAQVILQHQSLIGIIAAHINSYGGEILAEVPSTHVEKIIAAFREKGVVVTFPNLIKVDSKRCFDCGACLSLCPVTAIKFAKDSSVVFDEKRCIGSSCGLCVDICPVRAINLVERHIPGS